MKILRWAYDRRGVVRGYFDRFPHTTFYLKRIRNYYFLSAADWNESDPEVTPADREEINILINRELGREHAYLQRKTRNLT
ncbi:hypothetical protein GCM10007216_26260 [Thalassobacillus devorans]|uniref:YARHG domain-containing protein n=1 Tax=Thalassobacillus devorans TaxID=279813 RepID=A0ABQ1PC12_9BACI|nr:hypothetical protein [Thalassobacillus devorans]NIK29965.1 hypothetical protein [Thalassobacillus devorans]GGC94268.1 hypothetical protein GCM10007216_26260 [Thalassobacillus devorans]